MEQGRHWPREGRCRTIRPGLNPVISMLKHMRLKWSKLLGYREAHRGSLQLRLQVERLEDRSMLSASLGMMPHGHGGPAHGPHNSGGHVMKSGGHASES